MEPCVEIVGAQKMGLFGHAGWPCEKQRGPQTAIGGKTSQMGVAEKVGMKNRKRKVRKLVKRKGRGVIWQIRDRFKYNKRHDMDISELIRQDQERVSRMLKVWDEIFGSIKNHEKTQTEKITILP